MSKAHVKAAATFKKTGGCSAPDRLKTLIAVRRQWALGPGLDADFIENLYRKYYRPLLQTRTRIAGETHVIVI